MSYDDPIFDNRFISFLQVVCFSVYTFFLIIFKFKFNKDMNLKGVCKLTQLIIYYANSSNLTVWSRCIGYWIIGNFGRTTTCPLPNYYKTWFCLQFYHLFLLYTHNCYVGKQFQFYIISIKNQFFLYDKSLLLV